MSQNLIHNSQSPAFIRLAVTDSTNNYALRQAREEMAHHGMAIFADVQTAGKGQRGKSWAAAPGENIQMSVLLRMQGISLARQFMLSAVIALAVRRFAVNICHKNFRVKWPNDIYFQDRKAGGILIENIITGHNWKWAIVGIGLNVNQTGFDAALPNPVSLALISGVPYDVPELAKALQQEIIAGYEKFITAAPDDILTAYNHHLYKAGAIATLYTDAGYIEAVINGVNEKGELIVNDNGIEKIFRFGEVKWG